jgi:regulation of enolase protein 1 (concanavalin A-like superfamily)
MADTPALLRVVRDGDAFRFFNTTDGTTWNELPLPSSIRFPAGVQVGVAAINSTNNHFAAKFTQFRFQRGNLEQNAPPAAPGAYDEGEFK